MVWVHDTGYGPAYGHTGFPVAVQIDGAEASGNSAPARLEVIGWRSACDCGWRGMDFHPRDKSSSPAVLVLDAAAGWGIAARAEWDRHLHRALPELAVHDRARELRAAERRLDAAIHTARFVGVTWSRLAAVAGSGHVRASRRAERSSFGLVSEHERRRFSSP